MYGGDRLSDKYALAEYGSPEGAEKAWLEKQDLVLNTVAQGANATELAHFFHVAAHRGLDPLARQIYWVKRQGKGVIQVGIDGFRAIAHRTGQCAGSDEIEYGPKVGPGYPEWAKVTVYKMVQGQRCPFVATARWDEYYPGDAQGFQWKRMPFAMLGKCAEALALRKAFPESLSGMYAPEEMDQAGKADAIETEARDLTHTLTDEERKEAAAEVEKGRDGKPLKRLAFGYTPQRWPVSSHWGQPATQPQIDMMRSKGLDRKIDAECIEKVRDLVLTAYSEDSSKCRHTKAGISLYIDWLMNADDDAIYKALAALTAPDAVAKLTEFEEAERGA